MESRKKSDKNNLGLRDPKIWSESAPVRARDPKIWSEPVPVRARDPQVFETEHPEKTPVVKWKAVPGKGIFVTAPRGVLPQSIERARTESGESQAEEAQQAASDTTAYFVRSLDRCKTTSCKVGVRAMLRHS